MIDGGFAKEKSWFKQISFEEKTATEGCSCGNMFEIIGGYWKVAEGLFDKVYNPDVISCLANLSSDEVFTPLELVNQILDMIPKELFSNPDTTFLDPVTKTGVDSQKAYKGA